MQVTVYDSGAKSSCVIDSEVEPTFLSCGPKVVALGMNNHSWFFSCSSAKLIRKLQYVGSVECIHLNDTHAAALVDGKVYLHLVIN